MMESPSTIEHKKSAPKIVDFGILVISTSVAEGKKEDRSGKILRDKILEAGHRVITEMTVSDDSNAIGNAVRELSSRVPAIVSTGGTGLTRTDLTIETIRPLFSKELTGFTPLFMQISYEDVGPACMLSRATAGIIDARCVLFALPGSPKACELAMEKLVLPEVAHITRHFVEA